MTPQELASKAAAEASLHEFMRQAWPVIEPGTPFIDGEHIRVMCVHLEAVTRSEIMNLLINVPPGCCKSSTISVAWPAWCWISQPESRWLSASYSANLAMRDSLRTRQILDSPWYRKLWGDRFGFIDDQNAKMNFQNTKSGWRIATGVGGRGTGEHPDYIVVDDPQNAQEAASEADRLTVNNWWDATISSRGTTRGARRVVMQQRLHEDDLTGHILERSTDDWVHLCLPMRAEPGRMKTTAIGWCDTRSEGQLLWPEAMPEARVADMEKKMGPTIAAGQLQQRPAPAGGAMFRREWLEIIPAVPLPRELPRVRFWDCAASTKSAADKTAGIRLVKHGNLFIVESVLWGKWAPGERDNVIKQAAMLDGQNVPIYIEEEGGASGKSLIFHYVTMLPGYEVRGERHITDKLVRANPLTGYASAGLLKIMDGPNVQDLIDELVIFPFGRHDDLADALSAAFNVLARRTEYMSSTAGDLIASGDEDDLHGPMSEEEIAELPDYLKGIVQSHLEDDGRGYGKRGGRKDDQW